MTTTPEDNFLRQASAAARAAGHIFPDYAACEAALESTWGQSRLAREANNLFGQKLSLDDAAGIGTPGATAGIPGVSAGILDMPTQEFLHGRWLTVTAPGPVSQTRRPAFAPAWRCSAASSTAIPPTPAHLPPPPAKPSLKRSLAAGLPTPSVRPKVLAIHRQHSASFLPPKPRPPTQPRLHLTQA